MPPIPMPIAAPRPALPKIAPTTAPLAAPPAAPRKGPASPLGMAGDSHTPVADSQVHNIALDEARRLAFRRRAPPLRDSLSALSALASSNSSDAPPLPLRRAGKKNKLALRVTASHETGHNRSSDIV